jgi:hypothetical protein
MIVEILTAVGVLFREAQFVRAPSASTYVVYFDDVAADGPDEINRIFTHDISVEFYETEADPKTEQSFETELNNRGIKWTKQARYWLDDAQRYQVIYEFSYIEKI